MYENAVEHPQLVTQRLRLSFIIATDERLESFPPQLREQDLIERAIEVCDFFLLVIPHRVRKRTEIVISFPDLTRTFGLFPLFFLLDFPLFLVLVTGAILCNERRLSI